MRNFYPELHDRVSKVEDDFSTTRKRSPRRVFHHDLCTILHPCEVEEDLVALARTDDHILGTDGIHEITIVCCDDDNGQHSPLAVGYVSALRLWFDRPQPEVIETGI